MIFGACAESQGHYAAGCVVPAREHPGQTSATARCQRFNRPKCLSRCLQPARFCLPAAPSQRRLSPEYPWCRHNAGAPSGQARPGERCAFRRSFWF